MQRFQYYITQMAIQCLKEINVFSKNNHRIFQISLNFDITDTESHNWM